jgi:dienelactone hydrolase
MAPGVTAQPVQENGLAGMLFRPAALAPRPGVLVLGGSGGGLLWADEVAPLLASRGFVALALAYFRYPGRPDTTEGLPLEYFAEALAWLRKHPAVQGSSVAVVGMSRGGEVALLLAATLPDIDVVVAYVPLAVTLGNAKGSSWTYRGRPVLGALPHTVPQPPAGQAQPAPLALAPLFLASLQDQAAVRACAIPVERSRCPILLVSGEDDLMCPWALMGELVLERLRAHHSPWEARHLHYPGAGHYLRFPYLPTTVSVLRHPVSGLLFELGGTPEGDAAANADSWRQVLAFLSQHLTPPAADPDGASVPRPQTVTPTGS